MWTASVVSFSHLLATAYFKTRKSFKIDEWGKRASVHHRPYRVHLTKNPLKK